jgi:hypothetical protein
MERRALCTVMCEGEVTVQLSVVGFMLVSVSA